MSICRDVINLSKEVFDFIDNVSDLKEESITDYLTWKLRLIDSNSKFNVLNINTFTRIEEHSTTGADFELELWFVLNGRYIPMVFQAKNIFHSYDSYAKKILYEKNGVSQINTLINYSLLNNKIPLYMFYSKPDDDSVCMLGNKASGALFFSCANDVFDLALNSKYIKKNGVLRARKKARNLSKNEIIYITHPFHSLFCMCPLSIFKSIIHSLECGNYRFLSKYFPNLPLGAYEGGKNKFVHESAPDYVMRIIDGSINYFDEDGKAEYLEANGLYKFRSIAVFEFENKKKYLFD